MVLSKIICYPLQDGCRFCRQRPKPSLEPEAKLITEERLCQSPSHLLAVKEAGVWTSVLCQYYTQKNMGDGGDDDEDEAEEEEEEEENEEELEEDE